MQKPILKSNLRTGEKINHEFKTKEREHTIEIPSSEEIAESEDIKLDIKALQKAEKKKEKLQNADKERTQKAKNIKPKKADNAVKSEPKNKNLTKPKNEKVGENSQEKNVVRKRIMKKVETKKEAETYRVVYDKEQKNWIVKIDGGERASRRCETKEEALKVAKDLAKKKDADLSVHKKNGKFQKQ